MAWIWLLSAGLFEVVFATFLKLSEGFTKPAYSLAFIVAAILSFYCLTRAMHEIPIGTAYAIWTGIGTLGVVILGIFFFSETISLAKLFFTMMLVMSIIGLKLVSEH